MEKPAFPAFESYTTNPHPKAYANALEHIKDLAANDGIWEWSSETDGVSLSQYLQEGDAIPTVRGDGSIEGYTIEQILSVIKQPECRAEWDTRYEKGFGIELYSRNLLGFYASQKGVGYFVWPRDFTGIVGHAKEGKAGEPGEAYYYLQTSADMPNVPEFPKTHVRGRLPVAGFILKPSKEGTPEKPKVDVVYIVNVDPAGYIPSSVVAMVATEVPLCISRVANYLKTHGFVPYIEQHCEEKFPGVLQSDGYHHHGTSSDFHWKPDGAGSFTIYFDETHWTNGVTVTPGVGTTDEDYKLEKGDGKVVISFEEAVKGKNLAVIVNKA